MTGHATERDQPSGAAEMRARKKRPVRRAALLAFVTAVALFAGGFGLFANHISTLSTPIDPKSADGIVVLTGGQFRLDAAVDLLRSGKGKRLLISGVHPAADADDLQAATGADDRLFNCCIDIDHAALDTVGNAEESAKWVQRNAFSSIILVTNNYHMPRSLLEMRRLLNGAQLQPYPVVNTRLDNPGWLLKPDALRVVFTEYTKYLAALARGVIEQGESANGVAVVNARSSASSHQ